MSQEHESLILQDPTQAWLERCAEAARVRSEQRRLEAWMVIKEGGSLAKVNQTSKERRHQKVSRRRAH